MPQRADRGIERYDFATNTMKVCGSGDVPDDCGVKLSKKLFSPRLGIAWRISDSFVLRTGYGITYDPISLARTFRTNYPMLLAFNIVPANSALPAGLLKNGIPATPSVANNNGTVAVPRIGQRADLGRQLQTSVHSVLESCAGERNRMGLHGFRRVRCDTHRRAVGANQPECRIGRRRHGQPTAQSKIRARGFDQPARRHRQFALRFPADQFETAFLRRPATTGQLHLVARLSAWRGLGLDNDGALSINEPNFRHLNRGVLSINIPHNFQFSGGWELPFGKGKRWLNDKAVVSALAGGWQLSWLYGAFSGLPFSVSASGTSLNAPGSSQRADQVKPEVKKLGGIGVGNPFYDPTAFMPVTTARFGTVGFNTLRSPGTSNLDLGLFREFRITEGMKLQFRVEAFNATNTPHFAAPGGNASAPTRDADGNILTNPATGLPRLNGFMEITEHSPIRT